MAWIHAGPAQVFRVFQRQCKLFAWRRDHAAPARVPRVSRTSRACGSTAAEKRCGPVIVLRGSTQVLQEARGSIVLQSLVLFFCIVHDTESFLSGQLHMAGHHEAWGHAGPARVPRVPRGSHAGPTRVPCGSHTPFGFFKILLRREGGSRCWTCVGL